MRTLENILNIGLYLLVMIVFALVYLLINVIDWVKGKDGNDD